jgi:hypothetical protein
VFSVNPKLAFGFGFGFGDPPPPVLLTECPPTGDPELEVFDAEERLVPVLWCGIGIGMEEEVGGNPCAVAGGVNKWPAPFPLFPLVWYGCPCGEKPAY